jgi:pimeloyl-ACP methyl ester carboxylesterase
VSPDGWESDIAFLQRPNAARIHLDLFYDYRTNVPLYPKWQAFLRERQPKTIIFWGQRDIFFTPEGGDAYLADLPRAEIHRLDAGHFAVEEQLDYIASHIRRFHSRNVAENRAAIRSNEPSLATAGE